MKYNSFLELLEAHHKTALVPEKYLKIIRSFYLEYKKAVGSSVDADLMFGALLKCIEQQAKSPFIFEPFHRRVRVPFDYYQFGLDFINPLVDFPHSTLNGENVLKTIAHQIENKENVVFLANHQTEPDPQVISLLLQKEFPKLAEEMIFVAGERVITDPLAIPFSMGRNLLCIYSKRYIDHPPELKAEKQRHNKRTMELMSELLSEGGQAIYVAPSGGRDRRNRQGVIEVAPFDPQSVEMFYLMARRASRPTHFYPMALKTYFLLPPPDTVQVELGEHRLAQKAPVHIAIGSAIDMEAPCTSKDKHERRQERATYIYNLVDKAYKAFP